VRLTALLAFYDEQPKDLILYVASLTQAHVDNLIAIDGAYQLYPHTTHHSPPTQHATLAAACQQARIPLHLHIPEHAWQGNEPEKRTALFQLAHQQSDPDDWWIVLDTDELIQTAPTDMRDRLQRTDHATAEVTVCDTLALQANQPNWPAYFKQRRLYRAQPIHLGHSHADYHAADGTHLGLDPLTTPTLSLHDLTIWHAPQRRNQTRQQAKADYYQTREQTGNELGPCTCRAQATVKLETNWRWTTAGPIADIVELCESCARQARWRNRRDLNHMGIQPDSIQPAHRYGQAPDKTAR
jgi:hypothetical protein